MSTEPQAVEERTTTNYYLLNVAGYRVAVSRTPNVEGATVVGAPIEAKSYAQAKVLLQDRAKDLQAELDAARVVPAAPTDADLLHPIPPSILKQEPVFKSAHEALTFSFNFAGQQSPKTPMATLMRTAGLGSGRGLAGLDGAGQAGMVLAAVGRMPNPDHFHVIMARFGDVRTACPCCGQPAPDALWTQSVDALSQCDELRDLPKPVRHAAVEKVVCRRKLRFAGFVTEYGMSERTLRSKITKVKGRLSKLENDAMSYLSDYLQSRGVLFETS
jgi:hypothetical protein